MLTMLFLIRYNEERCHQVPIQGVSIPYHFVAETYTIECINGIVCEQARKTSYCLPRNDG